MAVLTLTEIKQHLRMDEAETDEDAHLERLSDAAQDYAEQYLGRAIPWKDDDGNSVDVPASVFHALLILVAELYENREQRVIGSIVQENPTVERLLHFYRVGMGI